MACICRVLFLIAERENEVVNFIALRAAIHNCTDWRKSDERYSNVDEFINGNSGRRASAEGLHWSYARGPIVVG